MTMDEGRVETMNRRNLATLLRQHGTQHRRFPDNAREDLRSHAETVMAALAAAIPVVCPVYEQNRAFAGPIRAWHTIAKGYVADKRGA